MPLPTLPPSHYDWLLIVILCLCMYALFVVIY